MKVYYFDFILRWRLLTLVSYFGECVTLGFILWRRLSCFFIFPFKNEVFTFDFVLWWKLHPWLCILTKMTLYFDESVSLGFVLWQRLLTLASYFDEDDTLGFILWWRLSSFFIFSLKTEVFIFGFVLWRRLHTWTLAIFSFSLWKWNLRPPKWRLAPCIFCALTLSYFFIFFWNKVFAKVSPLYFLEHWNLAIFRFLLKQSLRPSERRLVLFFGALALGHFLFF
jgi:hypothetical protein